MPRGDRKGKANLDPMTGRVASFFADYSVPRYINPMLGRLPYRGQYVVRRGGYPRGRRFDWSQHEP